MAKIHLLDSSVYNLIAAGEVVEKPTSIVKELVENSIDAGATRINVTIKNGGIDYICVSDNGCGIEKEDMKNAFLLHATSKISDAADLNSILTLGFRGEALASIAAVSKITAVSCVRDSNEGHSVTFDNGILVDEQSAPAAVGTTVTVENLFAKIPARAKYLRKPSTEEGDVSSLITKLILANPTVSFNYVSDGKKIFSTGEGIESALVSVYGQEILSCVQEISLELPDVKIRGYVGKPSFTKHSRNYQTIIVNGRYIKDEDISYMVYICFKDYLMTRQYPFFAIYIDLPSDMVDVNVHPNKLTVRFAQPERIHKLIRSAVNASLNTAVVQPKTFSSATTDTKSDDDKHAETKDVQIGCDFVKSTAKNTLDFTSLLVKNTSTLKEQRYSATGDSLHTQPSPFNYVDDSKEIQANVSESTQFPSLPDCDYSAEENKQQIKITNEISIPQTENFAELNESIAPTLVGSLFDTYILIERRDDLYVIDQHAAHERILYDKLVKEIEDGNCIKQDLLVPYLFTVSYEESAVLDENLAIFSDCGYDVTKMSGLTYSISAVPAIASNISLSKFLPVFFDAIKDKELLKISPIKDILAQCACKSVIKGNTMLTSKEIEYLVSNMNDLNVLLCPHGRPIVIKITKYDVEKWFKRK